MHGTTRCSMAEKSQRSAQRQTPRESRFLARSKARCKTTVSSRCEQFWVEGRRRWLRRFAYLGPTQFRQAEPVRFVRHYEIRQVRVGQYQGHVPPQACGLAAVMHFLPSPENMCTARICPLEPGRRTDQYRAHAHSKWAAHFTVNRIQTRLSAVEQALIIAAVQNMQSIIPTTRSHEKILLSPVLLEGPAIAVELRDAA